MDAGSSGSASDLLELAEFGGTSAVAGRLRPESIGGRRARCGATGVEVVGSLRIDASVQVLRRRPADVSGLELQSGRLARIPSTGGASKSSSAGSALIEIQCSGLDPVHRRRIHVLESAPDPGSTSVTLDGRRASSGHRLNSSTLPPRPLRRRGSLTISPLGRLGHRLVRSRAGRAGGGVEAGVEEDQIAGPLGPAPAGESRPHRPLRVSFGVRRRAFRASPLAPAQLGGQLVELLVRLFGALRARSSSTSIRRIS